MSDRLAQEPADNHVQAPQLWNHLQSIHGEQAEWINQLGESIQYYADLENRTPVRASKQEDQAQDQTKAHKPTSTSLSLFGLKPAQVSLAQAKTLPFLNEGQSEQSDFQLETLLGEGGMGRVYLSRQASLGREVALKIPKRPSQPEDQRLLAQVAHEAQITGLLDHPNILPIYQLVIDHTGQPIQVLKRISGVCWHDLIYDPKHPMWSTLKAPEGQLSFHLEILAQVSLAVGYAHQRGVIHRDLKPENVMLGEFGEVYVLDWGVALVLNAIDAQLEDTQFKAQIICGLSHTLVGTPLYLAPEMARCEVGLYAPACDVFLLGGILYELLCGRRARKSTSLRSLFCEILEDKPHEIPTHLTEGFRALLSSALSFSPSDRPQNGIEFRNLLLSAKTEMKSAHIIQRAQQQLEELINHLRQDRPLYELATYYDEARISYRTCLELDPQNAQAISELDELYTQWSSHLISESELKVAEQVIRLRSRPDQHLNALLQDAQDQLAMQERERVRLKEWRADEALGSSKAMRVRLAIFGLIFFGFGSLILEMLNRHGWVHIDAFGDLIAMLVLSALTLVAFLISTRSRRGKKDESNAIFHRIMIYFLFSLLTISTHRFLSWKLGLSNQQLIHHEMPLISLGCFGMSTISGRRDFTLGGFAFLFAAFFTLLAPQESTLIYALAMIVLWSGVLWIWSIEKGIHLHSRSTTN